MLVLVWAGLVQAETSTGTRFSFLEDFRFREVPLAESLAAKGPRVKQEDAVVPGWKRRWDEARQMVASGALFQAVFRYRELLAEKAVSQARWEMVTVLLDLGRGGEAIDDIEALCEASPGQPDYVQALAVSNLVLGRYRAAAEAFIRLNSLRPGNDRALAGAVYAFLAGGARKAALVPLAALSRGNPDRVDIREALAALAFDVKAYETALPQLIALCRRLDCPPEILRMAAVASEAQQSPEQAVGYWNRYIQVRPSDLAARQWLADYYLKRGQSQQALPHLEVLRSGRSDDAASVKRLGLSYLAARDYAKAAEALAEYLRRDPDDKEAARALVSAHEPLGDPGKTLEALKRYFAVDPQPDRENLHLAARLCDSLDDHDGAVTMLRRLLAARPGNTEIMTSLARHLEGAGRMQDALAVWRQLSGQAETATQAWRHIAAIEKRQGQGEAWYDALAKLHELVPADNDVSLLLVAHYARRHEVDRGMSVIADMERSGGPLPVEIYSWRAELLGQRHEYAAALADIEHYLAQRPEDQAARRLAMTAAGRLGDSARVLAAYRAIGEGGKGAAVDLQIAAAAALSDCRRETEARALWQKVLAGPDATSGHTQRAYAGMAESFIREGHPYEAEEWLRVGLAKTGARGYFLPRLVDLALSQRLAAEAEEWLTALRHVPGASADRLAVLEASVLAGRGEWRKVRQRLHAIEDDWAASGGRTAGKDQLETDGLLIDRLRVAALWIAAGKPQRAKGHCQKVLSLDPNNLEALALLEKVGDTGGAGSGAVDLSSLRFDQLCDLAEMYQRHGMAEGMVRAAGQALAKQPHSLKAGVLRADALIAQGRLAAALGQLEQLSAANPDDQSLQVEIAEMDFAQGKLPEAEALLMKQSDQGRPDLLLLRARMLWRRNQWDAAFALYRDFLTPRLAEQLRAEAKATGTALPEYGRSRTVWEVVTRDPGPDRDADFAGTVMRPAMMLSFLGHGDGAFALAAARLTAAYRWQAQFAMEYAARQSVGRREFTIAQKQYEAFLARYPDERLLLFDLAGIYSALGELGEEAAAYSALKASGVAFAELDGAMARNRLKQQPRIGIIAGYQSAAGRFGYVDRDKNWQGVSAWKSFTPLHDGTMTVERITYHAGSSSDLVRATRATGSYSAGVLRGVTLQGMAGVQGQEQTDRQAVIAHASIVGKVGEGLTGAVAVDRDVVEDTTASLERNIIRQDLTGGITLEPLFRLAVGGGYLARDYSDNNWTTGYDAWASYLLFAEPTFLRLKYSYEFKESREGPRPGGILEADGFAAGDHPYWAPKNYWLNQIGLFLKHSLAGEPLDREAPRYYTLEYTVGHDAEGYATQTAKASLFAECGANFLVEAEAALATAQTFRSQEYRLGVSYRW